MPNPITDVLWWINSEVNKLSGRGLARVRDVLSEAQAELKHDLQKARWLGTDDRYTAQVHRNALAQISGAIDSLNANVSPELADVMRANGHAAGTMATNHLAQEVAQFSSIFEGTVRPIALEAASVIAQGDRTLWPRYRTSAARYAGQVGDDIRRQLAVGLVRGETVDQMVNRLQRHGGPKGLVFTRGKEGDPEARAELISEGLFRRYRSWAERLVRTETVNAYNETALIGMDELEADDPGYFKRWDAAVDGRLCLLCRAFDDLVVPLHEKFPLGFDKPPRHPNCRCACVIWRKEWDEADVRDNIMSEVRPGNPNAGKRQRPGKGTIDSVPHKFDVPDRFPDRDYKAEAGKRAAKGGKFPGGIPESAPSSMTPEPARAPAPTRRPRRPRAEVQAERQARDLARVVRRAEAATRAMEADARRKARAMARLDRKADQREARARRASKIQRGDREIENVVNMIMPHMRTWVPDVNFARTAEMLGVPLDRATRVANRARRAYLKRTAGAERDRMRQARIADREEAKRKKLAEIEAKKGLKDRQKAIGKSENAALAAVRHMKDQPMATSMHPSVKIPKYMLDDIKNADGTHTWRGKITVEEATHAFAAPPGYEARVTEISKSRFGLEYYTTEPITTKDGRVIPKGTKAGRLIRDFYSNDEIHHSYFTLENFARGGFADTVNGQAMLRYEKWGLKMISVDAAWVGRYKWAKMGYKFKSPGDMEYRVAAFVRKHVPPEKQAAALAKIPHLVREPWKLADWDEAGDQYPYAFGDVDGSTSRGKATLGKAMLLDDSNNMWGGVIHLGGEDPGYLRALNVVQTDIRK